MTTMRLLFVVLASQMLTACFLTAGEFESDLAIRSSGEFHFVYRGEVTITAAQENGAQALGVSGITTIDVPPDEDEAMENAETAELALPECRDEETGEPRECTQTERDEWEAQVAADERAMEEYRRSQAAMLSQLYGGIDITDDDSMRVLAERLTGQPGWTSVSYRGDGVFDVVYEISGTSDRPFIFPFLEGFAFQQPFVTITPRGNGDISVRAPGFTREPFSLATIYGAEGAAAAALPTGTFTVHTDGEIRTNNTLDGPAEEDGMSVLRWTVNGIVRPAPELLVRLGR